MAVRGTRRLEGATPPSTLFHLHFPAGRTGRILGRVSRLIPQPVSHPFHDIPSHVLSPYPTDAQRVASDRFQFPAVDHVRAAAIEFITPGIDRRIGATTCTFPFEMNRRAP